MRKTAFCLHSKLRYGVGNGVPLTVGESLTAMIPSNDIFYDPPKLRVRLDEHGYLYFKNIIPREVVRGAFTDLASQMASSQWTLPQYAAYQAEQMKCSDDDHTKCEMESKKQGSEPISLSAEVLSHPFIYGLPHPHAAELFASYTHTNLNKTPNTTEIPNLPEPNIHFTNCIREAVSGTSVMALVRQVFGHPVHSSNVQTLQLAAPCERSGFRMSSVYCNKGTKLALIALVPLHDTPLHMGTPVLVEGSNSCSEFARIRQTYGQHEMESGDICGDGCYTEYAEELMEWYYKQQSQENEQQEDNNKKKSKWYSSLSAEKENIAKERVALENNDNLLSYTNDNGGENNTMCPFISTSMEAGDVLLLTVYTMFAYLTNTTPFWRMMAEAIWTMDGDDIGPDPRYGIYVPHTNQNEVNGEFNSNHNKNETANGLADWLAHRDDRSRYPRTMQQSKVDWGLMNAADSLRFSEV